MKRLVLFDIDGTLLHGGPLWKECFEGAVRDVFPDCPPVKLAYSGKTDKQICMEILRLSGLPIEQPEAWVPRILARYIDRARSAIQGREAEIDVLPGVFEVLDALAGRSDVKLALLTGNLRDGASLKLGAAGLDPYFDFGVFGDDHWDRYQLPGIAVKRAVNELGREFKGKDVVIIGDTIHDVLCGRSIGVRSIAVGTGNRIDQDELRAAGPDFYFQDLGATTAVVDAVVADL